MSALAISLLAISILILAAVLFYIGRSIAKCVELNNARTSSIPPPTLDISDAVRGQVVTIWVALYTQSTTLHNDIAKFLRIITIGAISVGMTLVTTKVVGLGADVPKSAYDFLSSDNAAYALMSLLTSLICTVGPLETLAYKQRDLANDLRSKFNDNSHEVSMLPDCTIPRRYHAYGMCALVFLFMGIILLALAASNSKL